MRKYFIIVFWKALEANYKNILKNGEWGLLASVPRAARTASPFIIERRVGYVK